MDSVTERTASEISLFIEVVSKNWREETDSDIVPVSDVTDAQSSSIVDLFFILMSGPDLGM